MLNTYRIFKIYYWICRCENVCTFARKY